MSVVILGGNERMKRRYLDTCKNYGCKAKVFIHMEKDLTRKIGSPDWIILFTSTASHQLAMHGVDEARQCNAELHRSNSSSMDALHTILTKYCAQC